MMYKGTLQNTVIRKNKNQKTHGPIRAETGFVLPKYPFFSSRSNLTTAHTQTEHHSAYCIPSDLDTSIITAIQTVA